MTIFFENDAAKNGVFSRSFADSSKTLFSYGFRPFFLFGALYAALVVAIWIFWLTGWVSPLSALSPVSWHTHELFFGYAAAIIGGFLLTAIPNWTGRPAVVGAKLAAFFALWLAGRLAIGFSYYLPTAATAFFAMLFLAVLDAFVARELILSKNRRNLIICALLTLLLFAQLSFFVDISAFGGVLRGDRLALAIVLILVMVIGGRIIPAFTTNFLRAKGITPLPTAFGRFDAVALAVAVAALAGWAFFPRGDGGSKSLAILLALAGILHAIRLARWRGGKTFGEALVVVLHVAYAFMALGFWLGAAAFWMDDFGFFSAAAHAWTIGAIGLMTLAVMTRATRGHTGRALTAPASTQALYAAIIGAALARIVAALDPQWGAVGLSIAAFCWIAAFGGFGLIYGPMVLGPRVKD